MCIRDRYQSVLTKLKGQSVCLVLDSTHSTIEKVNCDDLNSKQKVEEKQEEKTEMAEKTEATDEKTLENTEVQEEQQPTEDESWNQVEWVYDDNTGVYYHEDIGMYYDPNTGEYYDGNGTYYYWDEESQSFVEAY